MGDRRKHGARALRIGGKSVTIKTEFPDRRIVAPWVTAAVTTVTDIEMLRLVA